MNVSLGGPSKGTITGCNVVQVVLGHNKGGGTYGAVRGSRENWEVKNNFDFNS